MNVPALLRKKDEGQESLHLHERGRKFNARLVEVRMDIGLDEVPELTCDGYWFAAYVIDARVDGFRDPRVWWIENGRWWKDNVWGEPSSYGKVHLSAAEQEKYLLRTPHDKR